jgi:hypothetical protein
VRRSNKLLRSFQKWDSQREEELRSQQNPISPPKATQAYESPNTFLQRPSPPRIPSLCALIIGIDKYASSHQNLRGCVADANAVKDYFTEMLSVPEENIRTLFDENATRVNIISKIWELCILPTIQPGCPIVIYYAGHGSNAPAPPDWPSNGGKVRLICPYDYGSTRGRVVEGIPDRTLRALLEKLAKAKGNNIVRLLQSIHISINSPQ